MLLHLTLSSNQLRIAVGCTQLNQLGSVEFYLCKFTKMANLHVLFFVIIIGNISIVNGQSCNLTPFCSSNAGYLINSSCFWMDTNLAGGTTGTWDNYMADCASIASTGGPTGSHGRLAVIDTLTKWNVISTSFAISTDRKLFVVA